jgi:hypothetical protein
MQNDPIAGLDPLADVVAREDSVHHVATAEAEGQRETDRQAAEADETELLEQGELDHQLVEGRDEGLHRGREAKPDDRFRIAFNSYDAQSGGRRLMRLREILAKPAAKRSLTSIDIRAALVDGLLDRGEI